MIAELCFGRYGLGKGWTGECAVAPRPQFRAAHVS